MTPLSVGSLFAGIGGFDLGLEATGGFITKWQVEIDPYCQRVLAKHWPTVPRYGDIRTVDWATVEPVDVLCGGFPCQDLSFAGKRAGIDGARSGLWSEYLRAIVSLRPRYVIVENVPGLLTNQYMGRVLGDLAACGYDAEWHCIPASSVGAPHKRDRVWIVADSTIEQSPSRNKRQESGTVGESEQGQLRRSRRGDAIVRSVEPANYWETEPAVGELVDGISCGLVRFDGRVTQTCKNRGPKLKALGNAVVPQIVEMLGRMILLHEQEAP